MNPEETSNKNLCLPAPGTRVLITGITGQDGYYLARLLLAQGCHVTGGLHPSDLRAGDALRTEFPNLILLPCDLENDGAVAELVAAAQPGIIYHLAAQSSVRRSWEAPLGTARANALGTLALLDGMRAHSPDAAFIIAGSCDCYDHAAAGAKGVTPETPFWVTNPYAASKVFAQQLTRCYRDEYGLRAAVAIFFNHTSPRRHEMFVERGIVRNAARVKLGLARAITIGSWETVRDWSWAPELMEAFAAMGALDQPRDLVLASGRALTVRDWVEQALRQLDLKPEQVQVDASRLHAGDRPHTFGNIERTRAVLGWSPRVGLAEMVRLLIAHDLRELGDSVRTQT